MTPAARAVAFAIRLYRRGISPFLGRRCRYEPTCSAYAHDAVLRYGALRGGWMSLARIARCHPWAAGGIDRVPPKRTSP